MSLEYWTRKLIAIGGYSLAWVAILLSIFPLYLISPSKSWAVTGGTTLTVVPAAPTGLNTSDTPADDGKSINLSWTPSVSGGATEQRIYRGTGTGGPYSTLVTTFINNTTSSYTDNTGLSNGTTYYYVIRAFGGGQESSNSTEANAIPVDNIPPAAPAGFNAADVPGDNGGALVLNWTVSTSTDVTQQRIYRGTASGGPYPTLVTTIANNTTATYTDNTGLTNGTTYYYVIRSYDGTQESANSSQGSAIPIDNPPQPPTGLSAADVPGDNGGAIVLNWTVSASTDAVQQRIYRGTAASGPYGTLVTTIANNTTATYTNNTGLTNGTPYYYVIRTFDGTQESANSTEVNAIPIDNIAPNAPAGFSAADVAGDNGGAIVLNWTVSTSTDVTQQRIYRGTASGGPYATLVTTIANNTTATYTDNSSLTNGTTYYYVIRAFDATQESGNSTQSSAVPVDNIPPVAPTLLSAADVAGDNGGAIVLNWTVSTSTDVTQQRIYRGTAPGGPYGTLVTTIVNNTTATYTNNTGLTNGMTYYYVIRSFDGTQESGNSTEVNAIPIDNIAPNAPAGFSAADVAGDNGGAIVLNWTVSTSTDVTQQRIYRGTAPGGPYGALVTTIVNNTTATYTNNSGLTNGTAYYYVIRAFDGTQESGNSTESSAVPVDNTAPVAPTTLSAADVAGDNGGAIVLNWTVSTSTDVTQQRIYRGTASGGPYGTLVTTIVNNTTATYTDSVGLTNGTTYYYVIRAFDGTQESGNSVEAGAIPIDNPPLAPTTLSAADVAGDNGGAIVLNWTVSTSIDVTQQRIYRGTAPGGPYGTLVTTIVNNTTATYTDNAGLTNGTTYYYVVRAFDGTQESGNSIQASAIPLDNTAPVAPTSLSAADVAGDNGGAIVLNWTVSISTDVTQQRIYRGTGTGGPYGTLVTTISNNTTATYTDSSGLTNGTTYYYVIRTFDGTQESGNSIQASAIPLDNTAPVAATGLSAADVAGDNGGAIVLNWTVSTSTDVTQQRIYRGTATGGPYGTLVTTIANNTTSTYTDNAGLTNGTTYYYVVRAFDGTQESGNSIQASAVPLDNTAPVAPTSLSAADVAGDNGGAIVLNWTPSTSTDATQQRIYRGTGTGGPYGTLVTTISNNTTATYTDNSGLTNGTTYYYVIRTFDGTQESGNSTESSAVPADNTAPVAPTGLSAADVAGDNGGAIVLNWTVSTSTDVTQQRIYRGTATGGPYGTLVTTIANNTTATYTDNSGLTNGSTYYYVIRAFDGTQESGNSIQASAIPLDNTAPVAATGLSAADVAGDNGGAIVLNWTVSTSTDVTQQRIYRGTAPGGPYGTLVTTIANNTTATYTDSSGLTNGTTYYYVIRTFDGTQESGNSIQASAIPLDNTAPVAPTILSAADVAGDNGGAIVLNWTVSISTDVTQQRIYRGTAPGGPYGTLVTTIANNTTATYTDSVGLTNGTTYYYVIRAFDGTQESGNSTESSAVPVDNTAPVAPTTLSAADVAGDNGGAIVLNWTPSTSTDVTQQRIYRGTAPGGPYGTLVTTIANNTTATYTDSVGLTNGTTYYYVIRAFDGTQESGNSIQASAVPIDNPPLAPTTLSAADVAGDNGGAIVLNWTPSTSTDVAQQRIYRGTATGGPYGTLVITIANNTTATYTDNTGLTNGTAYYYVIRAFDGTQESGNSTESSAVPVDNTAPVAPTILSAADVAGDNGGAIVLNWTPSTSTDVAQQRIYRGTASGGPYGTLVTTIANNTTATYTDSVGLTNGTTYYYVIRAFDGTQESGNSIQASAIPLDNTAPVAPTGLSAADVAGDNGGAIVLNWTVSTSTDVTQQRIYRGTATGGPYGTLVTTIANNTTATYTDSVGLTNGTTYYYVIRAFDGTQESGNSIQASAIPLDNTAPVAPTGLSAADVAGDNGGAIVLNWTLSTSTDVTQQRIYRGTGTGGPYGTLVTTISNNTTATYTDNSGLTNGTAYYYVIRAFDGTQESGNSTESSAVPVDNTAPVAPTILSAADVAGDNGGAIVLNWTPSTSTDVAQQRIYRGTASGGPYGTLVTTIANNTTATYTDSVGLTNGTTYYYVIRAFDGTQESGNSIQASAIPLDNTAPVAPTGLSAADVAGDNGGAIVLNWTLSTSTDVTQQRIYRGTAPGGPYGTLVTTIANNTTATYTDNSGLTNGTTYYYVIRTFDGTQESGNSIQASAIPLDNTAPVAPTGLSAADVAGDNGGAIVLNWTVSTSTDVTQQRIYRGNAPGGPYGTLVTTIANNTTSTYTNNTGLTNGITYYYIIRSFDGTQESVNSNESSAIPIGPPSATTGTISATTPVLANGVNTSTVTVTVKDASNNPISGATGTLSSSRGATDTITQPVGTTDINGQITGTVKSATAGNPTITALVNGTITLSNTAAITFYNTVTGSNVVVSPTTTSQVTFTTVSSIGITSTQQNPSGTSLSTGYGNPTYYDISTTAGYSGNVAICITYNEAQYLGSENRIVLLHNEAGSWVNRTSGPVDTVNNIVCGNVTSFSEFSTAMTTATKLAVTSVSQSVTAGQASNAVTVEAQDSNNVLDTSYGGSVSLSSDSIGMLFDTAQAGPFNGTITSITLSAGTGTFYFKDTIKGTPAITVSATGLTSYQQSETILSGTVNAAQTTVTTSPSSITANGTSTSVITVTPKDAYGNILGSGQAVSLSRISGTGTLLAAIVDNGNGTYTQSVQSPTLAGSGIFQAVVNSVTITQTTTVNYVAGPLHHYAVTTTTPHTANKGWTETVRAEDIYNNLASGDTSTIVLAGTGTLLFYTSSSYLTQTTTTVLSGGLATLYLKNSVSETVSFTATRQGGTETGASGNMTVNAAPVITTSSLPQGTLTVPYSQTLTATGGTLPVTWSIQSGSLPAGLNMSSGGVISGSPTIAGTYPFTALLTDSNMATDSKAVSIIINAAPTISTPGLPDGTVGASYNYTVTAAGGTLPLSWNVQTGTLPTGISLASATGVISGIPVTTGTSGFSIRVTDANGVTNDKLLSIMIYGVISVSTTSLPDGTVGMGYSQTLIATGGKTPYNWGIATGSLPSGLSLNASSGAISGTPSAAGTYNFTVQVQDTNGALATRALGITINDTLSIATTALSDGTINQSYTQTLTASGGRTPYAWAITLGTLPAGLTLNSGTGVISGTPTAAGTSTFTVQVTDANSQIASKSLSISIYAGVVVTTASLTDGTVTAPYSVTLTASGGKSPYTWGITLGTLPSGLVLNTNTGAISGTPTAGGTYPITVQVTDDNLVSNTKNLSIVIYSAVSIATVSLADGTINTTYSQTLSAAGGKTPYLWSLASGTLPAGLGLNVNTGVISGTPSLAGTANFTVQVQDTNGAIDTKALAITIFTAVTITTSSLSDGTVNLIYSQTLTSTGGKSPVAWSIISGTLPAGTSLGSSSGIISGTPTASGASTFTVQAMDANGGTNTKALTITIYSALSIVTASLPDGTIGAAYNVTLNANGGKNPLTWGLSSGGLPSGLSLNSNTGVISGTPTTQGVFNFTLQVTDSNGATASHAYTVNIFSTISVTTTSLSDGTVNYAYSQTLAAAGGNTPYSWSVTTGAVPSGLTLNSSTGVISGTPSAAGTSNFTVQVTDANSATATKALSIIVFSAVSVTTTSLSDGTVNLSYSQSLAATGGKAPLVWGISAGTLPAGLSLASGTGVISGIPTASGTGNFTVQLTDANGAATSKALSIVIYGALSVTTTSLSDGTTGAGYSQTVSASGGKIPYTWSISAGTLPTGLTLNSSTGVISGTPTVSGTSNFTVQVMDANGAVASQALSIGVYQPLSITTAALSDATVNVAYSQILGAAGGKTPYSWSVTSGTLPTGVSLNASTGEISGTPTGTGTWNFTIQAVDAGSRSASKALSVTVYSGLTITTAALSDGTVTAAYSVTLAASGGKSPYAWAITVGSLPAGLTLNGGTGVISGTPTASDSYPVTVQVTDGNAATQTKNFTITVYGAVSVTTVSLSDGTVNAGYSQTLAAAGGKTPYTWLVTVGSLPTGLVLNGVTGAISGTPSVSGTGNFTVQVIDANGAVATQALAITIYSAVSVTTVSLSDGTVGLAYSQGLSVTGGKSPHTWSVLSGSLPLGLSLNSSTGVISGTPTASGTGNFTVQAVDANGAVATKALTIVIYQSVSVVTTTLPDGIVGSSYSQTLTANGGKTPYTWGMTVGALPAGITLNAPTGVISGTPTAAGTSNFTVQVTDANGAAATQALAITVYDTLAITTTALSDGTINLSYSQTLTATGGKPPLSWSVTVGVLPAGLTLDGGTGVISGIPTTAGTSNITVRLTDANGFIKDKSLSITVFGAVSVSTSALLDGTVGGSYSQTLIAAGGKTPYTWGVTVGTLPAGLTLNSSTGVISGTPTTAGTTNFTVQVTDANGATATKALSIVVYTALSITTSALNDATVGATHSQTLTAGGGKLPYVWSITAGSLPAGLALNTSTGGISGTPTTAGTYNFTAQVTDANGAVNSRVLSIVVYSVPTITTSSLSDGTVNLAYSQTLIISGGKSPFNWTILLGALPSGLSLNSSTGVISGTPTASGTSNFTVQATDANGAVTSKSLSINVYTVLAVTTTSLPDGTRTAAYSQTLQASGGKSPVSWGIIAGALPAGLTLNSSTGVISGTPSSVEIANFTVQVSDSNGAVSSKVLSIKINDTPVITTVSLSGGTAGSAYNQTLASSGGTVPLNWSVLTGSLPVGLTLNSATGVISGTPTVSGSYNFTIQVTDSYGVSGSKPLSVIIAASGPSKANILASKTSIVADGTDSSTLTITVYDANNNLIADGTTVTLTATNGTVTGTTTTVNGVVSRTIKSTLSGTAALGVESPSGTALTTITGNVSLNFVPGVPSQANISASKTSVTADGVDQTALTVTVRDANGNLAADGTTVTMTSTVGSVTGSGTTVSGVVTRYLSSLTSGVAILGVQSPTGTTLSTLTGNTNISFNAGVPAKAVISASKTTLISNGTDSSLLTVTVYDTNNNHVADGTTVTVTTTVGTISGTGTTINGVVTRVLTSTVSGTAVLGVEAPTGTVLSSVTGNTTIVINPSVPAQANIAATKTTIIANGTDSTTLTITVRDATGNLVPDGTTVKLNSTLGTVTGSGTTVSGVVTRILSGTVSGTAVLGVEAPTGTSLATITGNSTIIMNPSTPAGTITLVPGPSNIEANGITTSTVTSGVIRDAFGNAVLDNTLITVATDKGVITTADVSGVDSGIQVSTSSGVITFVVRSSTVTETANVTAQSVTGSASGGTQITFAAGPPSSVNSAITATSPVYSDGVSASTVTITVRDANNNPVTGANVSLSSSRGVLDNITQPSGTTNINGQIIGTVASVSTGNAVITATVNGTVVISQTATINFYNTMTGANVTVTPGSGTQLTFDMIITIGITSSVPAGTGPALPAGYGTPVYFDISTTAAFSGSVMVCITYNGSTYGVNEGLVKLLHDEGGVMVDRTTSINTATNTVCGRVTSFSIFATSVTTATRLKITSSPQTLSAGYVSNIVTVEAQDNNGALDPGVSGTVDVSSNSGTLMLDTNSGGTFAGNTLSVNIVNGIGNFYFKDTSAGTPTITVTDAGAILTPSAQQQTIVPAVPSGTITLTPAPASIVADGLTTSTVTSGIIRDAYGNAVSDGTLITVSTNRGTITTADASGGNPGIQVATVNGVISFVVQSGTVSGTANVTAVSVQGSAGGSTQITFLPGQPAGSIALTPGPASIAADGITTSTVTGGIITDAHGNTVSDGTLITVSTSIGTITTADASGGNPGIQAATVSGVISFVVQSSTVSGTANVTAVSVQGSASGSTQITFLPGLPAGAIILTPNPVSIMADGFTTSTVTSGIIADINGNAVSDGVLITVSTDIGTITTADASGVYPGIQLTTVSGTINFVVRSGTVAGVAGITAISVTGSAGGSTNINFTPGLPYGTFSLLPNPVIIPADGVSVSTVTSGAVKDANGNTVSDGTLITVSTDKGTIITSDASPGTSGIQVATSTGIIVFTVRAGTAEGTATVSAASVQGSANGLATITLTNVPPGLFYPAESGYGNGDGVEPNSGLRSTVYKFKIIYNDINNNPPSFMRICVDTNPCVPMGADTSAADPTLRDGNYGNGEQYIYTVNNFNSGDHTYYFETSDGLAYTKLPSAGSLSGPHVNYPPELSYSTEPGYSTDGIDPDTGNTTVMFKYKTVYRDLDNQAPSSLRVCIDGTCYAMAVDTSAAATLHDGSYTNGEQYVYSTLLSNGTHNYYFDTSDGLEGALLPLSGNLSGPIVTSTYTAVGTNVVVSPATDITVTFTQVLASGDTYVTKAQVGSALPSGYLHGNPPAYFDIWSTATYTGKIKICYSYNDATYFGVGYGGERGVRWLHYETGSFKDRTVMLDINNNFVCGEVYSFSEFSAAVEQATLVTLTSFNAHAEDGKVLLTWATASEIDSMGFNILRGASPDGPFVRINDWVIMSKGSATRSMKYSYEDTAPEKGVTYFYKLENLDINGRISAHMIASVTVPAQDASAAGPRPSDGVTTPSGDKARTAAPGISGEGAVYEGMQPVMETSPAEQGSGKGEMSQENETSREIVTIPQTEEVLPGPQVPQPEGTTVMKETTMQKENKELQRPFSLKFEDNAGNAVQVRLPENSEVMQEPFEITSGDRGEIILRWSASGNVKGYNILRSDGKGKMFKKVNLLFIPFFASQSGDKGLVYSFKDAMAKKDNQYSYKIETVLRNGAHKESKPIDIPSDTGKKTGTSPAIMPVSPKK